MIKRLLFFATLLLSLAACRGAVDPATATVAPPATVAATVPPTGFPATAPVIPSTTPDAAAPTTAPTAAATPTAEASPTSQAAATLPAEVAQLVEALQNDPPERDDLQLAAAYRGASAALETPVATPEPEIGATERFFIGNVDDNTVAEIDAVLAGVSDRAYFWFQTGEGAILPDEAEMEEVGRTFDAIYDQVNAYFGTGETPTERVHIVHALPTTLCVTMPEDGCRLSGYFSQQDLTPRWANPNSNERAMFVMNSERFDGERYFPVLAHELRHRIEAEFDAGDEDWAVEGSAMLAEDLLGYADDPQARGDLFLENTDQQLNSWSQTATTQHYGQGYLVSRYILDRLGPALYREVAVSPLSGLAAVDEVAATHGLDVTGESLWLDWLATMALVNDDNAPEPYRWAGPSLLGPITEPVDRLPYRTETTVAQQAADYYELPSSGTATVTFSGDTRAGLLGLEPPSGETFWYAERANYSNPRLTRAVDLRNVASATLTYQVYADIEEGYDFAYVSASTDGGRTWQTLAADGMDGLNPADDPSGSALGDRFYSSRQPYWSEQTIDLTPFAGQEILLRFEYITDPILTYNGFALDDIAIPEIGFRDDVESDAGVWTAEGFVRATERLPQNWHLLLISHEDGAPVVTTVPVGPDGRATFDVTAVAGEPRPVLIVAATAPRTLQQAEYQLEVE